MSVWEVTTYKLDIAREVYTFFHPFHTTILGENLGHYLQPRGVLVPVNADDTWEDLAFACTWEVQPMEMEDMHAVEALIRNVKQWSIGLGAVYKVIYACLKGNFTVRSQYGRGKIAERLNVLMTLLAGPSLITPGAFASAWEDQIMELTRESQKFEDFSEAWKYVLRNVRSKDLEYAEIDQEKYFGEGNRLYYGATYGPLIILVGAQHLTGQGLIMTRNHLSLLVEASARVSNVLDHASREHAKEPEVADRIRKLVHMTITDAAKSKGFNTDKVVQAYHKARSYMQMEMFGNEMAGSIDDALLEFQKKNLQTVMDFNAYVDCFRGIPVGRWLELLHVYKWMPPPDYDSTYAFTELYEHHMSVRSSALDVGASEEDKKLWKLIVKERKLNIAATYRKINSFWPTGLTVCEDYPTEESLDAWRPHSLFPYFCYGKDISSQIKDKTTVRARIEDEITGDKRDYSRNFLLWYLMNEGKVDTRVHAEMLSYGYTQEDLYARVAYKGEAHKPGSRLFFMSPPIQRILLGELEGNISRLASSYPASLQGMNALTRSERLAHLFDVNDTNMIEDDLVEYTCYVVTFDLSKFSPRFNPKVLEDLHEFWADVFAYKPIRQMARLGARSIILHTTNNLVMQYPNQGADLEGFRGRMMTLFHADLISAACRLAINSGYIVGKAVTAVFIDDGAVRIAARGSGQQASDNALRFLDCMQRVYAAAGQENHPNKTIVSKVGGELLAEQFVCGQKLKCPIKAGMRLYPDYESPVSSLSEEFDAMFSTIQGSVRDGCRWVTAYRRYAEAFIKAIYRWDRVRFSHLDSVKFALKLVTPKSLGGFGFPSLQALVSTTSYDLTIEGLGILNYICRSHPHLEQAIFTILQRNVVVRSPLQILRDPGRVRLEGPVLVEGRLVNAIVARLISETGPWTELIASYGAEELHAHATAVALCILASDTISLPVVKRIWDSTPLAYIEGIVQKFKRSASIQIILGERGISKVRRLNQNDVRALLSHFY